MEELAGQGKTPMLVAVDGKPGGVVAVADTVKQDSATVPRRVRLKTCDSRIYYHGWSVSRVNTFFLDLYPFKCFPVPTAPI